MVKEYQVTLIDRTGKYKPVSTIVKRDTEGIKELGKEKYRQRVIADGIVKICLKRCWSQRDLKKYGYLNARIREYDKEKIAAENATRYQAIKEAKYASGEWKRPKKE